jgi:hypothetical protein
MSTINIEKADGDTDMYIIVIDKDGNEKHMTKPMTFDLNVLKINI